MRLDIDMAERVYFIAVTPPPVNGMTVVSGMVRDGLKDEFDLKSVPIRKSTLAGLSLWTLQRQLKIFFSLLVSALVSRGRYPCYFVTDSENGLFFNDLIHARLLKLGFSHVFLHHHVMSYANDHNRHFDRIHKRLGKRATHIVLSETMQVKLESNYDIQGEFIVLGNSNFTHYQPQKIVRKSIGQIGFLSNISEEKGILRFLEVARALTAKGFSFDAEIAGPVSDDALKTEIEKFVDEAPATRRYLGPVHGDKKSKFLLRNDVLLFPSSYKNEAQPVTIFEAMAHSSVVISTDIGCIGRQLDDTHVFSPDRYCDATVAILENWFAAPALFSENSENALALFEKHQVTDGVAFAALKSAVRRL